MESWRSGIWPMSASTGSQKTDLVKQTSFQSLTRLWLSLITHNGEWWPKLYVFLITIDLALWQKSLQQLLAVQTWERRRERFYCHAREWWIWGWKHSYGFGTYIFKGKWRMEGMQKIHSYLDATKTGKQQETRRTKKQKFEDGTKWSICIYIKKETNF